MPELLNRGGNGRPTWTGYYAGLPLWTSRPCPTETEPPNILRVFADRGPGEGALSENLRPPGNPRIVVRGKLTRSKAHPYKDMARLVMGRAAQGVLILVPANDCSEIRQHPTIDGLGTTVIGNVSSQRGT